jgi:hypothetical protein
MTAISDCRFGLSVHRASRSPEPTVHIFLQRVVRHANGMLGVTPACSTLAQIESEIAVLQQELESVLKQARQVYAVKGGAASARQPAM